MANRPKVLAGTCKRYNPCVLHSYAGELPLDLDELCARLRAMSNEELLRSGRAAAYITSPWSTHGKQAVRCRRQDGYELIDGFKRLGAARRRFADTLADSARL